MVVTGISPKPIAADAGSAGVGRRRLDRNAKPRKSSWPRKARPDLRGESGPDRDRTCDLGIKSPLLYQLSYRPVRPV
jgi:hypothetical protein